MRSFSIALCALLFAARLQAEWRVVSSESDYSLGQRGAQYFRIVEESTENESATVEGALFSSKTATLRVIDDPSGASSLAATMQREHCIAGVNGGYFDPDFAPVGLLISDGRVVAPMRKAHLLGGVVSVVNGRVRIQRASEFSLKSKPTDARQCGPFLVENGKAIAGLNDTRTARRTFVATSTDGRAAIGYCSPVTLAKLAEVLSANEIAPGCKIQRALNLDGGSSSAFWFAGERGVVSIGEQKTVRDFLAITAKSRRP